MSKLCCPHCGANTFIGTVTRGCIISYVDDNETPSVKELADLGEELNIYKCASCKKELKQEELVAGVKCSECGDIVLKDDINENGLCPACALIHDTNKSPAELLRELLKQRADSSPVKSKMDKKQEKANTIKEESKATPVVEEVVVPTEDTPSTTENTEATTEETATPVENTAEASEEATKPAKEPKKRGRKSTKNQTVESKNEDNIEEAMNAPVTEEDTTVAENDISNIQEAPFPDVSDEVKAFATENATDDTPITNEEFPIFDMFNNDVQQETVVDNSQAF